jgi:hypothetical protein
MPYKEKYTRVRYDAFSGNVYENLIFKGVSEELNKKTSVFTPPERDGSYVQDLGYSGSKFPCNFILEGEDHRESADRFIGDLLDSGGPGTLFLPYREKGYPVVATKINRSEGYVDRVNITDITVEFLTTNEKELVERESPKTTSDSSESASQAVASSFSSFASRSTPIAGVARVVGKASDYLGVVRRSLDFSSYQSGVLGDVLQLREEVGRAVGAFSATLTAADNALNDLLTTPLIFAGQIDNLCRIPIFSTSRQTLASYSDLIDGIIGGTSTVSDATVYDANLQQVFIGSGLSALAEKLASTRYESRDQAVKSFSGLRYLTDKAIDHFSELEEATSGYPLPYQYVIGAEFYSSLKDLLSAAYGDLYRIIRGLKVEMTVYLPNEMSNLEFVMKYYPDLAANDLDSALALHESLNPPESAEEGAFVIPKGEVKVLV